MTKWRAARSSKQTAAASKKASKHLPIRQQLQLETAETCDETTNIPARPLVRLGILFTSTHGPKWPPRTGRASHIHDGMRGQRGPSHHPSLHPSIHHIYKKQKRPKKIIRKKKHCVITPTPYFQHPSLPPSTAARIRLLA
ncbi:hypothetical protein BC567DRAFT_59139 [Phyllosticta citribraziliensis]